MGASDRCSTEASLRWSTGVYGSGSKGPSAICSTGVFGSLLYNSFGSLFHKSFISLFHRNLWLRVVLHESYLLIPYEHRVVVPHRSFSRYSEESLARNIQHRRLVVPQELLLVLQTKGQILLVR